MRRLPIRNRALLGARLDQLVATFDVSRLSPDPLELVHRYSDPHDQEVAGLLAAAFAYGRADIVVRNVGGVLDLMGASPHAWLRESFSKRDAVRKFRGFSHRFHKTPDLVALFERIAVVIRREGSLGELFRHAYDERDRDIAPSLERFVSRLIAAVPATAAESKSLSYLLSAPSNGSACKRMNLFLRWMVRREPPDLGLWSFVDPAKLVMPLDTHVHRITSFLGLNRRRTADWKTARELTDTLAKFDATDPVRYDFAICRLGILDLCSRRPSAEACRTCLLNDVCSVRVEV